MVWWLLSVCCSMWVWGKRQVMLWSDDPQTQVALLHACQPPSFSHTSQQPCVEPKPCRRWGHHSKVTLVSPHLYHKGVSSFRDSFYYIAKTFMDSSKTQSAFWQLLMDELLEKYLSIKPFHRVPLRKMSYLQKNDLVLTVMNWSMTVSHGVSGNDNHRGCLTSSDRVFRKL